jgi:DNA-binding transcriptional ArsR family regulator
MHLSLPRWATRCGYRSFGKLCDGQPYSISQLTKGSKLTRQAITKHLRVLENVGIVHGIRTGRESRFEFDPEPIKEIKKYLDRVSKQWDQALLRLKLFVEDCRDCALTTKKGGDSGHAFLTFSIQLCASKAKSISPIAAIRSTLI